MGLPWLLSLGDSFFALGSGKSEVLCSFINMLTYFVQRDGHDNREKETQQLVICSTRKTLTL